MTKYLSSNLLVMIHSQYLETGWQTPDNLWLLRDEQKRMLHQKHP